MLYFHVSSTLLQFPVDPLISESWTGSLFGPLSLPFSSAYLTPESTALFYSSFYRLKVLSLSLFFSLTRVSRFFLFVFFWLVDWFFCLLVFHTNNQVFLLSDESGITGLFATYVHRATEVNKTVPCNVIGGEELILAKWIMIRNCVLTSVSLVFRSQNTHCI